MTIIEEVGFLLLYSIFIYLWNTYIIPRFIRSVVRINRKNSSYNWLLKNEHKIVKAYQSFFWGSLILYVLSRLFFAI